MAHFGCPFFKSWLIVGLVDMHTSSPQLKDGQTFFFENHAWLVMCIFKLQIMTECLEMYIHLEA